MEYSPHAQHWLLLSRVVQQVVLQKPASRSQSTQRLTDDDGANSETINSDTTNSEAGDNYKVQFSYWLHGCFIAPEKVIPGLGYPADK